MVRKLFNRIMFAGLIMGLVIVAYGTNAFAVEACGWQLQYNPDPDPAANQLRAVWGPSGTEVFAVGDYGTILHTTDSGSNWSLMLSGITVNIYGVWGTSATNVIAVGDSGNIRKYDGSTWSAMTSGTTKRLRDVWGTASDNVIAVGEDGTIRKYNGTSWGSMTSNTTLTLQGVWGSSSSNVFAVGGAKENQTGSAIIQKYNGTAWSNNLTYTSIPRFHDVWGTSDTNVYVVGEAGTILHTTDGGTTWNTMSVPSGVNTVTLRDIWGTSDSDIFAVGDGPAVPNGSTILHYDGTTWSIMSHPRDDKIVRLHGVWGSSSDNFFAVGEPFIEADAITKHGTILHTICSDITELKCSNALPDGNDYATVFTEVLPGACSGYNGVKITVVPNESVLVPGSNYGIQRFGFNYNGNPNDLQITVYEEDGVTVDEQWSLKLSQNISEFGVFAEAVQGTGKHRHNPLIIEICNAGANLTEADVNVENALGYNFVAHIADFTFGTGSYEDDSAYFSDCPSSTVIALTSFTATARNGRVKLEWVTASETDNVGFNIYRAKSEDGQYIKINDALISAQGSSTEGAVYEFFDNGLQNRKAYYYKLEDIDFNGQSTFHGPVKATPRWIYGIKKNVKYAR